MDSKKNAPNGSIRLNKYLALNGIASRRHADRLIDEKQVMVDGDIVTTMGLMIDPDLQRVEVNGVVLKPQGEHKRYFLLNKPKGVVCTSEVRETRRRAIDLIEDRRRGRIFTVGRLDEDTEGLVILTNDGDFANQIAHPRHGIKKTYQALVHGRISDEALNRLRSGIRLSDYWARFREVRLGSRSEKGSVIYVTLEEGRNREVRRAFVAIEYPVFSLTRVQIGPLVDRKLRVGQWRPLLREEINALISEDARNAEQYYSAPRRRVQTAGRGGRAGAHARRRAAGGRIGGTQREEDSRGNDRNETRGGSRGQDAGRGSSEQRFGRDGGERRPGGQRDSGGRRDSGGEGRSGGQRDSGGGGRFGSQRNSGGERSGEEHRGGGQRSGGPRSGGQRSGGRRDFGGEQRGGEQRGERSPERSGDERASGRRTGSKRPTRERSYGAELRGEGKPQPTYGGRGGSGGHRRSESGGGSGGGASGGKDSSSRGSSGGSKGGRGSAGGGKRSGGSKGGGKGGGKSNRTPGKRRRGGKSSSKSSSKSQSRGRQRK